MKNIIFYFTGTGNCYYVAKRLKAHLEHCELVPLGMMDHYTIDDSYVRVGFVYPVYFTGMPNKVSQFMKQLHFHGKQPYTFAIASFGGMVGNGVRECNALFEHLQRTLSYGASIKMMDNYIVLFKMAEDPHRMDDEINERLTSLIADVQSFKTTKIKKMNLLFQWYQKLQAKKSPTRDKHFVVDDACIACAKCFAICPVDNIQMKDGKPRFKHHCEQCMACIQYCPKQAINYKQKTQKKRRFTSPEVSFQELVEMKERYRT